MHSAHPFTFPHPHAQLKEVVEGTAPHFGVKVEWDLAMVYADDPDGVPEQADEDTLGVVRKLVHDAALMLGPRVEVTLDGRVLPATAEQYLRLYKDAQLMGWVAFFLLPESWEAGEQRKGKRGKRTEREREEEEKKKRGRKGRERKREREREKKKRKWKRKKERERAREERRKERREEKRKGKRERGTKGKEREKEREEEEKGKMGEEARMREGRKKERERGGGEQR